MQVTDGDMQVFDALHSRTIVNLQCQEKPAGNINQLLCNNIDCCTTGPCFRRFATVDCQNLSKLVDYLSLISLEKRVFYRKFSYFERIRFIFQTNRIS